MHLFEMRKAGTQTNLLTYPATVALVPEQLRGPQSYFPSIEATYGRPMDYWFSVLANHHDKTHMRMVMVLKSEHGLGHGHANAVVAHYRSIQNL